MYLGIDVELKFAEENCRNGVEKAESRTLENNHRQDWSTRITIRLATKHNTLIVK